MKKYKLNKGFIYEELKDKYGTVTIFDAEKSVLLTLNEPASFIFKNIKKGLDLKQISEKMLMRYSIDKKRVKTDLEKCLNDFLKRKIIA